MTPPTWLKDTVDIIYKGYILRIYPNSGIGATGLQTKEGIIHCCDKIILGIDSYVWRDKQPSLPEETLSGLYYFNFYSFKPYNNPKSNLSYNMFYGPDLINNPYTLKPTNFVYILPKGVTDKNLDKDIINNFDQIIRTFRFIK